MPSFLRTKVEQRMSGNPYQPAFSFRPQVARASRVIRACAKIFDLSRICRVRTMLSLRAQRSNLDGSHRFEIALSPGTLASAGGRPGAPQ
jgi:hypothetical protein